MHQYFTRRYGFKILALGFSSLTAAIGLPALCLVRSSIGPVSLASHPRMPGEAVEVGPGDMKKI